VLTPKATRLAIAALALGLASTSGCRDPEVEDVPNRVLDRPSDLALTCVQVVCTDEGEGCHVEARSMNQCANERNDCTDYNAGGADGSGASDGSFHLVGFIANSERNEIAMFTKCSGSLVDMDQEAPGYNFIAVGALPTDITSTEDSCRVISSDRGSCTMSVLETEPLAGYGLELPSEGAGSSFVAEVEPKRYDSASASWVPLGAWPGELVSVPTELSHGIALDEVDPVFVGCAPEKAGSVYMTFPSCGLVAEVDLLSGHLLQSFQFVVDEDTGEVLAMDQGQSPECPVDCPALFDDDEIPDFAAGHPTTIRPQALALVTPDLNKNPYDDPSIVDSEDSIADNSLYVGGLGSSRVLEIRMDDEGNWIEEDVLSIDLPESSGISRIRASPVLRTALNSTPYQFLYVIAGDGSTRVVSRDFSIGREGLGQECDTQLDPVVRSTEEIHCAAVAETPGDAPLDRRGFASGPGIQAPVGAKFTDWSFQFYPRVETGGDAEDDILDLQDGAVAVGTTNFGGIVFSVLDGSPFDGKPPAGLGGDQGVDPAGLFEASLWPHVLYPQLLPTTPGAGWEPRVGDDAADLSLGDTVDSVRFLSPSLRLVDYAYADDSTIAMRLGNLQNADRMGSEEIGEVGSTGYYENGPPRVVARDYRSWGSSEWELQWEGEIPGTSSSAGKILCDREDDHGWADASCLDTHPDSSRLRRENANFCDAGVVRGDKLVLLGCVSDTECGIGQRCLRENDAASESSGICISEQAYEQDAEYLRQVCEEFISDPCGEVYREYLITQAFQDELWLQALDVPYVSFLDEYDPCEAGTNNRLLVDADGESSCDCLPDFEPCTDAEDPDAPECCPLYPGDGVDGDDPGDGDGDGDGDDDDDLAEIARVYEREARLVCTDEQVEGGCAVHEDCREVAGDESYCVDGRCMRECEGYGSDDCTYRRLPGPACFSEFVRYRVTAHKSFVFRGSGAASFISDWVQTVDRENPPPDLEIPQWDENGPGVEDDEVNFDQIPRFQCIEAGDGAFESQLMTSRIRLPHDSEGLLDIPTCASGVPDASEPNPCRIAESRESETASTFHRMRYENGDVPALRFSNPVLSIVLDLTNLAHLASDMPDREGEKWPASFRLFRRSRIPRGYRQRFTTAAGYSPMHDGVVLRGSPLTFPTRVINAPEYGFIYVVDSSGPGSGTSIRGQIMRITLLGNPVLADENFDGVR
jgi:hypothetical protein